MSTPIDIHNGADMQASQWSVSVAPILICITAVVSLFGLLMLGFRTRLKEKDNQIELQKKELLESRAVMRQVLDSLSEIKGVAMHMGGTIQSAHELTKPGTPIDPKVLSSVLRPAIDSGHDSGILMRVRKSGPKA